MRELIKKVILIFICTTLSCCEKNSNAIASWEVLETQQAAPKNLLKHTINPESIDNLKHLKLIKRGEVRYQVKNVVEFTEEIQSTVQQMGGYISSLQFENNPYNITNTFTIKIPQDKFNAIIDSLNNQVLLVDYENISTQDVTEEFVDLQARLQTKLEIKSRYETILRKKATTVKDILEAEQKIGEIQEEIEANQGRYNYLKQHVALSTVVVKLFQKVKYVAQPNSEKESFFSKSIKGFNNGWSLIESLIIGLISLWPILLIIVGIWFFFSRRKRNQQPINNTKDSTSISTENNKL